MENIGSISRRLLSWLEFMGRGPGSNKKARRSINLETGIYGELDTKTSIGFDAVELLLPLVLSLYSNF